MVSFGSPSFPPVFFPFCPCIAWLKVQSHKRNLDYFSLDLIQASGLTVSLRSQTMAEKRCPIRMILPVTGMSDWMEMIIELQNQDGKMTAFTPFSRAA